MYIFYTIETEVCRRTVNIILTETNKHVVILPIIQ